MNPDISSNSALYSLAQTRISELIKQPKATRHLPVASLDELRQGVRILKELVDLIPEGHYLLIRVPSNFSLSQIAPNASGKAQITMRLVPAKDNSKEAFIVEYGLENSSPEATSSAAPSLDVSAFEGKEGSNILLSEPLVKSNIEHFGEELLKGPYVDAIKDATSFAYRHHADLAACVGAAVTPHVFQERSKHRLFALIDISAETNEAQVYREYLFSGADLTGGGLNRVSSTIYSRIKNDHRIPAGLGIFVVTDLDGFRDIRYEEIWNNCVKGLRSIVENGEEFRFKLLDRSEIFTAKELLHSLNNSCRTNLNFEFGHQGYMVEAIMSGSALELSRVMTCGRAAGLIS